MDEETIESDVQTVGERLRVAREAKGLSLEDIAAQTRIPQRHLKSLETGDWEQLPATTYTTGFAKSYATAVGLDRTEIGEQLRAEMGGARPITPAAEVFEPADPARTMPKWLVFGAVGAVILLIVVMTWLNERSLNESEGNNATAAAVTEKSQAPARPVTRQAQVPQGQVVLSATAPAWIQVTDGGTTLFQGELAQGQSYSVPQTAAAPLLKAGKPEALRITVGTTVAPPVGPAGKVASNVSLRPADLLRTGSVVAPVAPPAAAAPKPREARPRPKAPAATTAPASAPPASAPPSAPNPPSPPTNTVAGE